MINKKDKNNLSQMTKEVERFNKEISSKIKGFKIGIGDDGLVRLDAEKIEWSEMDLDLMMNITNKYKDITPPNLKILVKIGNIFRVPPLEFRRKAAEVMKGSFQRYKFKKLAICGGGAIPRAVLSFILKAVGLKNIKHFTTEEKALKWLKED